MSKTDHPECSLYTSYLNALLCVVTYCYYQTGLLCVNSVKDEVWSCAHLYLNWPTTSSTLLMVARYKSSGRMRFWAKLGKYDFSAEWMVLHLTRLDLVKWNPNIIIRWGDCREQGKDVRVPLQATYKESSISIPISPSPQVKVFLLYSVLRHCMSFVRDPHCKHSETKGSMLAIIYQDRTTLNMLF